MFKSCCFLLLLLPVSLIGQAAWHPTEALASSVVFRQEYLVCATEHDDLVTTPKGIHLLNDQPFSGCVRNDFPDHEQYRVSYITAGVVEKEVSYYYSGTTHAVFNFKEGLPHGYHTMYYPDGSKYIEEFYVKGVKEGYHRRWLKNGQLAREERFSGGGLRPW
jgi:antitoxin component YwqK of YwqJK toxin-antitoxin module